MNFAVRTVVGLTDAAAGVCLVSTADFHWLAYTTLPERVVRLQGVTRHAQLLGEGQNFPLSEATGISRCADCTMVAGRRDGAGFWLRAKSGDSCRTSGELGNTRLGPLLVCVHEEPELLWMPETAVPELFIAKLSKPQGPDRYRVLLSDGVTYGLAAVAHQRGVVVARLAGPSKRLELLKLEEGNIARKVRVDATVTPQAPRLVGYGAGFLTWWTAPGGLYMQRFDADLVPCASPQAVVRSKPQTRIRGAWLFPGPTSYIALVFDTISPERRSFRSGSRNRQSPGKPAHVDRHLSIISDESVGTPQRLDIGIPRAGIWTNEGLLLVHGASLLELALVELEDKPLGCVSEG